MKPAILSGVIMLAISAIILWFIDHATQPPSKWQSITYDWFNRP